MPKTLRKVPNLKNPHERILQLSYALNLAIVDPEGVHIGGVYPGSDAGLTIQDPKGKYGFPTVNSDVHFLHQLDDSLLVFSFLEIDTHDFKNKDRGFRLQFEGVMYLGSIPSNKWYVLPGAQVED